ncbi:patatin-like phospholipase family protein [Sorangium sp. So ce1335]|uniref:patatin-like phospholipase family protein n=1 Tax=Sorangium sp. So ce1335 TaxID=3133335 RepID=UPI003F608999
MSAARDERPTRRSLILAGGGMKVAFQAGVLEVWLDEAGLTFDHVDGASGGTLNLAMLCQGLSGSQIADSWRRFDPSLGFDLNLEEYMRPLRAESIATLDRFRRAIREAWRLDFGAIRASHVDATFNVYNFTKHALEALPPSVMTEDHLMAAISLPMWFPPVVIGGDTYVDSVFSTDANLEEAIRRGADEIWVIWTVSERGDWNDGFIAHYFQIIEMAANSNFRRIVRRIEDSNAAIARGERGEFDRVIRLRILRSEVPVHYVLALSADRLAEAVHLGVREARAWCDANGVPRKPGRDPARDVDAPRTSPGLSFSEVMKGHIARGDLDPRDALARGKREGTPLEVRLTITVDGVDRFVTSPEHEAKVEGNVVCDAFGGALPIERGTFNLLLDQRTDGAPDPTGKHMLYRLFFRDDRGRALTLSGRKDVRDDPGLDLWDDTSTLTTRIYRGHVSAALEPTAEVVASGILRIHLLDFMRQLTTFRAHGETAAERREALLRFGRLFLGKLWDVYGRDIVAYGPF